MLDAKSTTLYSLKKDPLCFIVQQSTLAVFPHVRFYNFGLSSIFQGDEKSARTGLAAAYSGAYAARATPKLRKYGALFPHSVV